MYCTTSLKAEVHPGRKLTGPKEEELAMSTLKLVNVRQSCVAVTHDSQCCLWKITLVRNWYGPLLLFITLSVCKSTSSSNDNIVCDWLKGLGIDSLHMFSLETIQLWYSRYSQAQTENCDITKLTISNTYNLRKNILKTWNIYMALTAKLGCFQLVM